MKLSEFWLREWINPAISSKDLSEQMIMAGLEINSIKPVASQFHGVIVGEIIQYIPHPNTNALLITKVNIGTERLLNIVCKKFNCHQGLKVAVATIGAILPNNFKIKATKLQGELSEGILCSYVELTISNNYTGIIELPHDAPIGIDIRDYLQLDDHIFELNLTTNRADCLSILGIARDIAAINGLKLNMVKIEPVKSNNVSSFPIIVEESIACPRFLGRIIRGINISITTPIWIKEKLRRSGIYTINSITDITNFVLLELGQPLHAYDLNYLNGALIVRMAKTGEILVLFDNSKISLKKDTLVIADKKNILGIAGILNGKYSSVNQNTVDILLESAFFNPLTIINQARSYGIHTEISHRFERGVDPQLQYKAIERATKLIVEICGGYVENIIDVGQQTNLPKTITIVLTRYKLDRLVGYTISDNDVIQILQRLGFQLTAKQQNNWSVVVPSWRFDIQIEEDLIEEIIRVYGYNNIPGTPLQANLIMTPHNESTLSLKRIKILLIDRGYNEAITYSFVNPKIQELLYPNLNSMILSNPISDDMSVMRLSLLPGLISILIYNQNHQQNRVRLFETGLRFIPDNSAEHGVRQELMLAGIIAGNRYEEHWLHEKRMVDFFDIKGDVEAILELTGRLDYINYKPISNSILHPGQSANIYMNNNYIGRVGVIHPELENKLNLHGRTLVFELLLDAISKRIIPKVKTISRFPSNRRDIAIIVPLEVPTADVLNECKKAVIDRIVSLNLFDVYCGDGIAKGYKSLAISLVLHNIDHTLNEEEITITVNKCIAALKQRFQASLRS